MFKKLILFTGIIATVTAAQARFNVIFLTVDTGGGKASSELPQNVGILVPADVDGPNLETKQRYTFVVDVKKEGALVARSYTAQ